MTTMDQQVGDVQYTELFIDEFNVVILYYSKPFSYEFVRNRAGVRVANFVRLEFSLMHRKNCISR